MVVEEGVMGAEGVETSDGQPQGSATLPDFSYDELREGRERCDLFCSTSQSTSAYFW